MKHSSSPTLRSLTVATKVRDRFLITFVLVSTLFATGRAFACGSLMDDNVQLCIDLYSETYLRLPQVDRTLFNAQTETFFTRHADGVMSQRNEGRIISDWTPENLTKPPAYLRPFILNCDPGTTQLTTLPAGGKAMYRTFLVDDWGTNMNGRMDDNYDPLVRQYYLDLRPMR